MPPPIMLSREGAPDERGYRLRRMLAGARSIQQMPAGHSLNIALRTYTLALSLSLGPTLVSLLSSKKLNRGSTLKGVLAKHLSPTAFPFAITLGVTAGAWLNASRLRTSTSKRDHDNPEEGRAQKTEKYAHAGLKALAPIFSWFSSLDEERKVFICNLLSSTLTILLLRSGNKRIAPRRTYETLDLPLTLPEGRPGGRVSPTLDLTLLLFVRALDSLVQRVMSRISSERATVHPVKHLPGQDTSFGDEIAYLSSRKPSAQRRTWTGYVDAFTFWSSSSRIMWCFFYEPNRLPRSYVKWINALAEIDIRLIEALRALRAGTFSYVRGTMPSNLTKTLAVDLGCSPSWGDASLLPAYGEAAGDWMYKTLGIMGRERLGGLPCEIVHGGVDQHSCTANAARRSARVFLKSLLIYTPVQFLPVLLTRPHLVLSPARLLPRALAVAQSSAFLSAFVGSIWLAVCATRTLVLARLFPGISHDIWDGPQGCILAGCLVSGGSIFVESARRRGEIALYVLPRAVRSTIPERWLRSGRRVTRITESVAFALSLATLLTAAVHRPDTLRGMSRWMLAFVMKGSLRKPKPAAMVAAVQNGTVCSPLSQEQAEALPQN